MDFRVYLRSLELEDYKTTIKWRKEEEMWDNFIGPRRFVSSDTEKRWVERSILEHEKGERLRFIVCLKETNELIGLISFSKLDLVNKSCSIGAIIAKEFRQKGILSEASNLAFHYLFGQFGIKRIEARVMATNRESLNYVEKYGYKKEGILRKAVFKNGEFIDLIAFSILDFEFYKGPGKVFIK